MRRQALATEQAVFDKLRDLEGERARYHALAARVVSSTLARELPAEGLVVEIGGDGHPRTLLPAELGTRLVHTEKAGTERLPFADGEVAALVGLCVLDVLPDLPAAIAELRRVLRPGGRVIHFLDQNPYLKSIFARVASLGFV